MKINTYVVSDKGKLRDNNEDNFFFDGLINEKSEDSCNYYKEHMDVTKGKCFAVADGMGGYSFGEEASKIMVNQLKRALEDVKTSEYPDMIDYAIHKANDKVCELQEEVGKCGTTCASILISKKGVQIYNIGDSRVYLIRNNSIKRLTNDHSIAALRIKMGLYKENDKEEIFDRRQLTNYIGMDSYKAEIDKTSLMDLKKKDVILLCSDGLYDMCLDAEILRIMSDSSESIVEKSDRLLNVALDNGGEDNITFITIQIV